MSVTRVPQLLESSYVSLIGGTSAQVLANLGGVSSAALTPINASITAMSAVNTTQTAQIVAISAVNVTQSAQIVAISAGLATAGVPRSEVSAISGALYTDITNVGIELGLVQLSAITWSGSAAPATGSPDVFFTISISGSTYRLGVYS